MSYCEMNENQKQIVEFIGVDLNLWKSADKEKIEINIGSISSNFKLGHNLPDFVFQHRWSIKIDKFGGIRKCIDGDFHQGTLISQEEAKKLIKIHLNFSNFT